jgi:CheY-like chemotaxis protein
VKQIDLVLADLVMGARRREALVAAIRGAARRNPREVPVVAMSEREMWEDLKMFSAADAIGATAVLRKPLSAGTLIQLLDNLLQSTPDHADIHPTKRRYIEDNFQENSGDHPARGRNRLH